MSEKGDLPQDTESLPPHYASSEVYSDSPPPAYRKTSTVRLQITKIVCLTILLGGFLIGSFILAHTYVANQRACNCEKAVPNLPPMSDALIQANVMPVDIDNDIAPNEEEAPQAREAEPLAYDDQSRQMDIEIPLDEEELKEDLEIAGRVIEEEAEELQHLDAEEVLEEPKKVKLPIDMLLGNPALTGKDVQCKVEKKMQNLGNGVFSRTIMVTCDDDNEEPKGVMKQKSPFGMIRPLGIPPRPPMSFIAPILKMMAARADARFEKQQRGPQIMPKMAPKIMVARLPISHLSSGPFGPRPFPGAFGPLSPPDNHIMRSSEKEEAEQPRREIRIIQRSKPEMRIVQGNIRPNILPFPFMAPRPINHQTVEEHDAETFEQGPPPQSMLFREDFDRDETEMHSAPEEESHIIEEDPEHAMEEPQMNLFSNFHQHHEQPEVEVHHPFPQPEERPVKIIRGVLPQIPEAIQDIVSSIMRRESQNPMISEDTNGEEQEAKPFIAIKAIPQIATIGENPEIQQGPVNLPFPFRPVKIIGGRGARKLDLDDEEFQPNNLPFPLPRGAIPSEIKPLNMLEAEGRALESPVTIPAPPEMSPSMRFFPGGLVRIPLRT